MKSENRVHLCWLFVVSSLWLGYCNLVTAGSNPNAQINWLIRMQDPNTGLVESYEGNDNNFAYTFDQALAVIAFTEAGEVDRAKMILNIMADLQPSDPNRMWYECYHADDPNEVCDNCELYNTGPIAWMVIAINYYEDKTADMSYALIAHRALDWLDTMWNTSDPNKYGSLRYCKGPDCTIPNSTSTEHNIDAYSAYYWRGVLDSNDSYIADAGLILSCLRRKLWGASDESIGPPDWDPVNVFWRGFELPVEFCTDPQSWGVLSLEPIGPDGEEFYKSLCWLLEPGSTRNSQHYNDDINDVDGFRGCTGEQKYIEVDFTEHVAAAFYSIGDDVKGDYFHNQMGRIVDANGGLVHSFCDYDPNVGFFIGDPNKRYNNYRYNYVASAAWYYFNEVKINPFILSSAPPGCRAANINKENFVNLEDFAILALDWLESNAELPANIDGNSPVNFLDVAILAKYWLCGCDD